MPLFTRSIDKRLSDLQLMSWVQSLQAPRHIWEKPLCKLIIAQFLFHKGVAPMPVVMELGLMAAIALVRRGGVLSSTIKEFGIIVRQMD